MPPVKLTPESMQAAREWTAKNARACIEDVKSGKVRVNDERRYFESCERRAAAALAGEFDNCLAFRQRAYFIQTGDCPALLP